MLFLWKFSLMALTSYSSGLLWAVSSTIWYISIRHSVLRLISSKTSYSILMSWPLWLPKRAQFEQILSLQSIQIISMGLLCIWHKSCFSICGAAWADPLTALITPEPRFIVFLETPGSSAIAEVDPILAFLTMVIARYPNLPDITGLSIIGAATYSSYDFYSSIFFLYFSDILRSAKFLGYSSALSFLPMGVSLSSGQKKVSFPAFLLMMSCKHDEQ